MSDVADVTRACESGADVERKTMAPEELQRVRQASEQEGFDYAFGGYYSDFAHIKDARFHELYAANVKAMNALAEYIGVER